MLKDVMKVNGKSVADPLQNRCESVPAPIGRANPERRHSEGITEEG